MIEKLWYGKNKWYWLLIPFSFLYGAIVALRRYLYDMKILKSWQAPIPVVVVGNLSVGGNGKTPLVISLVEALTQRNLKVGIVSRGYGGKAAHYPLILNEETTAAQAGDEPILIYQRTRVPVAVAPKRVAAVKSLLKHYDLDVILTDDGLQHYALARTVEIVVIDAKRQFGNGWWLPAGPMRERAKRLKSVDMVVFNGEHSNDLNKLLYSDKTYTMQLKPLYAINMVTHEKQKVTDLPSIYAIAGISHPQRFFDMLIQMQAEVINTQSFADHEPFTLDSLDTITTPEQTLLMTEKDAVKCRQFAKANWWYLPIDATLPIEAVNYLYSLLTTRSIKRD